MERKDFYFNLPKELIAQTPLLDRAASRLLVLDRAAGGIEHKHFSDILDELVPGDCLVLNETKVIPARLFGEKESTGAKLEFLLLNRRADGRWETLAKPSKRANPGDKIVFGGGLLRAEIEAVTAEGSRIVRFDYDGIFEEILDALGEMPLPPYITEKLRDKNRYQTVYAKHNGSAAAPTAGLHFTNDLLDRLAAKGVVVARVTLHVGLGTFRPVKVDDILEHKMHSEFYEIDAENAEKITNAKKNGGRIIAVGTTSLRTLESVAENGMIKPCAGSTDIFIYPGYTFKLIDGLITNFHLPESTLIMLVSALCGRENTMNAYDEAIAQRYRFFSFGDAMFIR
ncbi:MAG: tRNA preQ1(34) S-adenosylmethionine ribosyltransferase-isomerase QueA [Clostridiales bacterium]|nr:tRNA preQ1(34) S-adenosylmethionine ribosyltransferase-isomerase QueA [Clostridiales bacterium]